MPRPKVAFYLLFPAIYRGFAQILAKNCMKRPIILVRWLPVLTAGLFYFQAVAAPEIVSVIKTNWVQRWITNTIEVRMPQNTFVNEFHTNSFTQYTTNVVHVYMTNTVVRTMTNYIPVEAVHTVTVNSYQTNWTTRTQVNRIPVAMVRTNFVDSYQTNWETVNLTNWQTVIVMQTNWITQPVTNLVQLNLPAKAVVRTPPAEPKPAPVQAVPRPAPAQVAPQPAPVRTASSAAPDLTDALALQASKISGPSNAGLIGVSLKVWLASDATAPVVVKQWRIERTDGSILSFGEDQVFQKELPPGKYDVEVRAGKDGASILTARATLEVFAERLDLLPKAKTSATARR